MNQMSNELTFFLTQAASRKSAGGKARLPKSPATAMLQQRALALFLFLLFVHGYTVLADGHDGATLSAGRSLAASKRKQGSKKKAMQAWQSHEPCASSPFDSHSVPPKSAAQPQFQTKAVLQVQA